MSFERTAPGLTNTALFYGVDSIVFVEGKEQTNECDLGSLDLIYWTRVFEIFAPSIRCRVVCRGSKNNLIQVARTVVSGEVSNVLVAMDRDYDFDRGDFIDHPAVFYTRGYSWENDVWTLRTVQALVKDHALVRPLPAELAEEIVGAYEDFMAQASRLAVANLGASLCCGTCVVPTADHRALVKLKDSKFPSFNKLFLRNRLRDFNRKKTQKVNLGDLKITPNQHCLGHLIAFFGYHLTCATLRHLGQHVRVDFEFLSSAAINIFANDLKNGLDECSKYFQDSFKRSLDAS